MKYFLAITLMGSLAATPCLALDSMSEAACLDGKILLQPDPVPMKEGQALSFVVLGDTQEPYVLIHSGDTSYQPELIINKADNKQFVFAILQSESVDSVEVNGCQLDFTTDGDAL